MERLVVETKEWRSQAAPIGTPKRPIASTPTPCATIVLYSPDVAFCASLRMLFQDNYHVITTTDPKMLVTMAHDFQPRLVMVDCLPTEVMKHRFEVIRKEDPDVRILVFDVTSHTTTWSKQYFRGAVDATLSKPAEISEIIDSVRELTSESV